MANDLTLLYYTANTIKDFCAVNVRDHLLEVTKGQFPIISVSQKPIDFGTNICVGEIGRSYYNCYKQILIGAEAVKTKYVACCEDDTLYSMEHFAYRPSSEDVFAYNLSRWFSEVKCFWQMAESANDYGMDVCIAPTKLLVDTLAARYKMYPEPVPPDRYSQKPFQEPGKFDFKFGIPNPKIEFFRTKIPNIVFNYRGSLGGKKGTWANPQVLVKSLPDWGNARDLWSKFWDKKLDVEVAIFIPTYKRADKLLHVYRNAKRSSVNITNVYFVVEKDDQESIDVLNANKLKYFINERSRNYSGAINTAYLKTTERYFCCAADDLDFHPGWLEKCMEKMVDPIKIVGTNDLHNRHVMKGEYATTYLIDREYIKTRSGTFDEENIVISERYFHDWSDREIAEIARLRGVYAYAPEAVIEHLHWVWGLAPKDETYSLRDASAKKDELLFHQRQREYVEKIKK